MDLIFPEMFVTFNEASSWKSFYIPCRTVAHSREDRECVAALKLRKPISTPRHAGLPLEHPQKIGGLYDSSLDDADNSFVGDSRNRALFHKWHARCHMEEHVSLWDCR